MRILIVGGGKIGGYLAQELDEVGHAVTVTEKEPDVARELSETMSVLVIEGDGTGVSVLKAAEASRADWLLAVTGLDEVNLVACEIGQTLGAKQVLARLNDPRNRSTFDALNIPVVAVTDLIVQLMSREIDLLELDRVALLGRGGVSLIEVEVHPDASSKRVLDLELPEQTILVGVLRDLEGARVVVPTGDTVIGPRDRVLAVTAVEQEPEVRSALRQERAESA
jgi:trk system potassium uptake protein TrkA